jgi:hypothetical protein
MEINKKTFLNVLSQIKAYRDIVIFRDSLIVGCLDILYGAKVPDSLPMCVNKIVIRLGGSGTDLFDDTPIEKLGKPVPVFLSRVKGILRDAQSCILKDGYVNGIRVEVDKSDVNYSMFTWITNTYDLYSEEIKHIAEFASVSLQKIDYAYMVSECTKFVSNDPVRYVMTGICFDFVNGGKDSIHMVATDGKKLCLLKQSASHSGYPNGSDLGRFIVSPNYLHIPDSDYNSVSIRLSERYGQVLIFTEDYHFEGLFQCIEGYFPNYIRIVPEITEKTQWFTLCAGSFRKSIDSVKSLMGKNSNIYLNAENPENLQITVADGQQTLDIEGTASRPMRLSFLWEQLSACLFDSRVLTKFWLDGSNKIFQTHEIRVVKGLTLDVTKIFMPTSASDNENHVEVDEFRIPLLNNNMVLEQVQ